MVEELAGVGTILLHFSVFSAFSAVIKDKQNHASY
jgi:hypothetical protein